MKTGFYPRLALDGIRKNKKLYIPYILTGMCMVMMYYVIMFLQFSKNIRSAVESVTVTTVLALGSWVIAIFSCIFLFYTNSFLMKRRKKEFGLYNILGMDKNNLGKIIFWETAVIWAITLVGGLGLGIAFSKLAELAMLSVLQLETNYSFTISSQGLGMSAIVFSVIYLLLLLNSIRQIRHSAAVSLIKSENTGEKPPKANWLFGIAGIVLLAVAYYIAVTIKEPIQAITLFFVAVIMVIVATYLIMISGSVLFCRILQRKKSYYYKPNHFVSVSSMTYRMRRNGAGLASICVLATMVLVMLSSTASLYFGAEDAIVSRYPRDINIELSSVSTQILDEDFLNSMRSDIAEIEKNYGTNPNNTFEYRCGEISGLITDDTVETDIANVSGVGIADYSDIYTFYIIPIEDYNRLLGTSYTLKEGEAMIYLFRDDAHYDFNTISFNRGQSFKIVQKLNKFIDLSTASMSISPSLAIFVSDLEAATFELNSENLKESSAAVINYQWRYGFDTNIPEYRQIALSNDIRSYIDERDASNFTVESREQNRADFFSLYGGLFCLGIILSFVFLIAAVLIIYYKQISEGYEDRARFEIMQKVGMTKKEIRKSINSQLLTVFFLPLLLAGLHLTFAFPMIKKLLILFNLSNLHLFILTTIFCYAIFALFYMIIYKITSNAYYKIVS